MKTNGLSDPGGKGVITTIVLFVALISNSAAAQTNSNNPPPQVQIDSPTNGETFPAPTNVPIAAMIIDPTSIIATVQFFAGANSLGILAATNLPFAGPGTPVPAFITWSNAPAGNYTLTVVETDNGGLSTTSAPVNITVLPGPFRVQILTPTNEQTFLPGTNITVAATFFDPDGYVTALQFFAGANSLGIVTAFPAAGSEIIPPAITWTNVPAGDYRLTVVATDNRGLSTTSAPVYMSVFEPGPPVVRITGPTNGAVFHEPADVSIYVIAYPENTPTATPASLSVEFFAGTNCLGFGVPLPIPGSTCSNCPPPPDFGLVWSNAPSGNYVLTAKATDTTGASTVSAPVNITIIPPEPPPIISVLATDPVAVASTNAWARPGETNSNHGPKNALFTVRRSGATNVNVTVPYVLSGTASNGVDYVALPASVTINAGQRDALITVVPLINEAQEGRKTVVLTLEPATNAPPDYVLGFPRRAAVLIVEGNGPHPGTAMLPGHYFHLSQPGPNAAWFRIETSTNLMDWTPVCTNQVVNGYIDFIDPNSEDQNSHFYRAVPLAGTPLR